MKLFTLVFAFSVFSASGAFAASVLPSWSVEAKSLETSFDCKGSTPDTSIVYALNTNGQLGGSERIGGTAPSTPGATLVGSELYLSGIDLGSLAQAPTCALEDADEPWVPSWVAIHVASNVSMTVSGQPDPSTCVAYGQGNPALEQGYTRLTHVTFKVEVTGQAAPLVMQWVDSESSFHTLDECQTRTW